MASHNYTVAIMLLVFTLSLPAVVVAETALENDLPMTGLQGSPGSETHYYIDVPAGASNLVINISGGRGDADLYVAYNRVPEDFDYDCRPYMWGNNETCSFRRTQAGTYHVMLRGYYSYADLTLIATYDEDDGGDSSPEDCELSDTQQALWDAHNEARSQGRTCGRTYYEAAPALTWNCKLDAAATKHAMDMAENDFFSHTGSDGSQVWHRVQAEGYAYRRVGENIAAGYSSVLRVMNGWLSSPGHCANIMSKNYTELGAEKVSTSTATYPHYWTVVFGDQ